MRVYLTGATGLVGSNVWRVATERHGAQVFAAIHRRPLPPDAATALGTVDIRDRDAVLASVRAFRPDAIVHAAALVDLGLMYRDRRLGWASLVEATRHFAEAAREVGAKMVFVSSDWVFDGTQAPATEETPPNPINYYGVMKVVGEALVGSLTDDGAVARVAGVWGVNWARDDWEPSQNAGFGYLPNAVVRELAAGRPFTVWTEDDALNQRANATLAADAAAMIFEIIRRDARGVFHCVGGEGSDRLGLARATARAFGFDEGRVRPGPIPPETAAGLRGIPIPGDTRLGAAASTRRLGHEPMAIEEALRTFRRQMETGAL